MTDDDRGVKNSTKHFDARFRDVSLPDLMRESDMLQYARAQRQERLQVIMKSWPDVITKHVLRKGTRDEG